MRPIGFNIFPMLVGVLALCVVSCNSKNEEASEKVGIEINFTHQFSGQPFALGKTYSTSFGEEFTPSMFDYYISNIKLLKQDGSTYTVPQDESYFLIRQEDTKKLTLKNIPDGTYSSISFQIGIDSARSTAPIEDRKGVLDLAEAMYWQWNSGYIFLKFEGSSPEAPEDSLGNRRFRYHIGGFGGYNTPTINNIQTVTLPFSENLQLNTQGPKAQIQIKVDVAKFFDTPSLRISNTPQIMLPNELSKNIASNYVKMFSLDATSYVVQ